MFGIALDLPWSKFKAVFKQPKSIIAGLTAQLILLPLFTYFLIIVFKPQASIALGMILIASCPGGNISNFISYLANANIALSICLTTITSLGSIIFTPLNFAFYGQRYEPTREILQVISLNWLEVIQTIGLIILLPILIGTIVKTKAPKLALMLAKPIEKISMLLFIMIVIGALFLNLEYFKECISAVFVLVLLHNTGAIAIGFVISKSLKLPWADIKSISIETGIQNSGLGLLIIFSFFSCSLQIGTSIQTYIVLKSI